MSVEVRGPPADDRNVIALLWVAFGILVVLAAIVAVALFTEPPLQVPRIYENEQRR